MSTVQTQDDETTSKSPESATSRRWAPSKDLRQFFGYDEDEPRAGSLSGEFSPAFDVKETATEYLFVADVPGLKDEHLQLSLAGNRLEVSGRRPADKFDASDTFYARERAFGAFVRVFTLPADADTSSLVADLQDGVLKLSIPRVQGGVGTELPLVRSR